MVSACWNTQHLSCALPVHPQETPLSRTGREGTRNIDQRSPGGHGKVGCATGDITQVASNALDYRNWPRCDGETLHVEWSREHYSTARKHEMPTREITTIAAIFDYGLTLARRE